MLMLQCIQKPTDQLHIYELQLARVSQEDQGEFCRISISQSADQACVSKPTLLRFFRGLSYQDLSDFKLLLTGSIVEGVPFFHRGVRAQDRVDEAIAKVTYNTRRACSTSAIWHRMWTLISLGDLLLALDHGDWICSDQSIFAGRTCHGRAFGTG